MGMLVKNILAQKSGSTPREIYHVALMPCFDKKLEASRSQFTFDEVRDVDCVITPVEIEQILREECPLGLSSEVSGEVDWPWEGVERYEPLTRVLGSGSGGYAHSVMSYALKVIFGLEETPKFTEVKRTNNNVVEASVEKDGQTLKCAVVTGFKNIQNLVNKLKRNKCDYHYIEVMACPSGCLNGGAQIKGHLQEVSGSHSCLPLRRLDDLHSLYTLWFGGPASKDAQDKLKTTFKAVSLDSNPLAIKW